jgi:hypothetical protein
VQSNTSFSLRKFEDLERKLKSLIKKTHMKRRRSLRQLNKLALTFSESQQIKTSCECKKRLQRFALDVQRKSTMSGNKKRIILWFLLRLFEFCPDA